MTLTRSKKSIKESFENMEIPTSKPELNVINSDQDSSIEETSKDSTYSYATEEEPILEEDFTQEYEDEEAYEEETETRDFSQNNVSLCFSWSLMNQLRHLARTEGISVEDLLIELVSEGVTKRAFEDHNRPSPSHLMTRNGYVHNDGHNGHTQPQMSHHSMNNNRNQGSNLNNRNKMNNQPRNNQYNNRYQNNRNFQNSNRNNLNNNGAQSPRQGNAAYNTSQKFLHRQTNNNQNYMHNQASSGRSMHENTDSNSTNSHPKNKKY